MFKDKLCMNIETYIDEIMIKAMQLVKHIKDLEEAFRSLKGIV